MYWISLTGWMACFLTGSPSNLEPHHYLGDPSEPGTWHDPHRDLAALALIPAAIRVGMPLLAVCRGFQEMNVSFGGTLHQMVHELPQYWNAQGKSGRTTGCSIWSVTPGEVHRGWLA